MRIALVNPPVPAGRFTNRDLMGGMGIDDDFGVGLGPRFVALLKNEGTRLPVIALAYAAALLDGHDVTVLDQSRLDPHDPAALDAVARARPDWVVAATSFAFLGAELRYLERVRAATGARRMLLQQAATFFAGDILQRGLAEAVSAGDPEVAVRHLARGTLAPGLDGVWMGGDDGRPVPAVNGFVRDLDELPDPRWDGFPLGDYGYFPLLKKRPFLTMLSSRGCPYQCSFCPYPVAQGAPFRPRSAARVAAEMERLVDRFGARSVLFRDPTFSLDMTRVRDLCRLVIERRIPLAWGIETRLDRMDEAMIELLGRAGCRSAEFGMDPIDEHTRQASHRKGIKPARAAELIRTMERNGIATAGLFVVGIPEQSEDEMHRTLDWIETLEVSYMNYEVATPFPGTELYAQAVRSGWTKPIRLDDLLDGDPKLSFNGVIDLARMKALQDRALSRFYLRPRKVAREILNADFVENVRFMARSGLKFARAERKP
jgi:radical SAM superfamily enzyme YgiQ (UPF0313 family)